jgi:RecA-family ATPase
MAQGTGNGHDKVRFIDPIVYQDKPIPERRWLVRDWIPHLTVTGIYGDGGVGKSLLGQQLITAAATGKPWVGLPVEHVKMLGIFCEDDEEELIRRQHNINQHYGINFADLENMRWLPRFGEDNILLDFSTGRPQLTHFWHQVLETATDFGAEGILIDTLADTYGGNENDRSQSRHYVQQALGRLARCINGSVVALAHPSRVGLANGSGDAGSTGWNNSFRSRAYLSTPEDDVGNGPRRILERKKANYASRDEIIDLEWQHGVLVPTGVIVEKPAKTKQKKMAGNAQVVFDSLNQGMQQHGAIHPGSDHIPHGKHILSLDLWRRFAYQRFGSDMADTAKRVAFFRARESLMANGTIGIWDDSVWIT